MDAKEEDEYLNSCMNEYYHGLKPEKKRGYIKDMLQVDILKVTFTKKDGTLRDMYCTLQNEFIPEHKEYHIETVAKREKNMSVLSVFDVEKADWRSFRIDSIADFAIAREEELEFEVERNAHTYEVPF